MQEKLVRGDLRTLFAVASLSLTNYNRQDAQDRTDSAAHSGRPVEWERGVPPTLLLLGCFKRRMAADSST